ncbi:lycopene cyclase family protein [Tsukamurella sp. 8F]|uniref:lycopene cyclase family protein n=1 Tax=unclassified Tsukamurella TaxID=2633480 RepID=UPI0023B978DF|nr:MULTISPECIES: lycopene cyclase family protein [unclassified Tsukamurella]MDF0528625.1 lycopene cyclase family protein [Tsukamurella sp. 8J]MDF0585587.1 lycopene cyclase family protein [Tsukamurella sp. 8F]
MTPDVVVLGLGPAGRAAAHRASAAGMAVRAFDPAPDRRWHQRFGVWTDEVPAWLPPSTVAVRSRPQVFARTLRDLDREYALLDTPALQDALTLDGVDVVARAVDRDGHGTAFVLDARGAEPGAHAPRQTAAGVVVPRGTHSELWMDWRPAPGVPPHARASFLYAVPVASDRLLLEETCLAGAPPLAVGELDRRLRLRLADRGVAAGEVDETVDFTLAVPGRRSGPGWAGAGVRGTTLHPATGYSVGAALALADAVASGHPPVSRADTVAHRMRIVGLRALLALDAEQQRDFFEAFFALPSRPVAAYLSPRSGPVATAAAMAAVFRSVPWELRRVLAASAGRPWVW